MPDQRTVSIADIVFERLEEDILSGVYREGEYLTELRLCEILGVSRTPVREALSRLVQEGLVKETGKGAKVLGVSLDDLIDIYEIRYRIEGYATRKCAERISDGELRQLRETLELQEFYTEKGESARIKETDSRFHSLIYEFCGSKTLFETLSELHRKVQRYRKMSVENGERAKAAVSEHREIYLAIEARDGERAEALVARHIENAKNSVILAAKKRNEN